MVAGLVSVFGLQALINIASSIGAAPTKGMTLPLISYGGSSMVSSSILIGILLNFSDAGPVLLPAPYAIIYSGSWTEQYSGCAGWQW